MELIDGKKVAENFADLKIMSTFAHHFREI